MNDPKKLDSQQTNIEDTGGRPVSGDYNDISGKVESGGFVFQGGEHKIVINQNFGTSASPEKNPREFTPLDFEPLTIQIPDAGPFVMGRVPGDGVPKYEEAHEVRIPEYYIGLKPVVNSQYAEFVRDPDNPRIVQPVMQWRGQSVPDGMEDEPVLGVTWQDALEYCEWLARKTGRKYSLPNEAQWEKACRGSYPCADGMGKILEWTRSPWGQKRNEPDSKYFYPWKKDDGRNDMTIRHVLRGFIGDDPTGIRRASTRYGRAVNDPGSDAARYGFRVALAF